VRFLLLDRSQQDVLESVRGGEVDFGVVVEPPAVDDLHCEAILHDPIVLVTPLRHPLAQAKSIRWEALDGSALVLLDGSSGSRRYIDDALAQHGAVCKVEQELAHPTTVFQMVEAGIGLTVMLRMAVPPGGLRGLTMRPLIPRLERTVMLVRRNDRALSPVAERVWKIVSATVRAGKR
jgi:DNA-binding transcriptional LysR family regulator